MLDSTVRRTSSEAKVDCGLFSNRLALLRTSGALPLLFQIEALSGTGFIEATIPCGDGPIKAYVRDSIPTDNVPFGSLLVTTRWAHWYLVIAAFAV